MERSTLVLATGGGERTSANALDETATATTSSAAGAGVRVGQRKRFRERLVSKMIEAETNADLPVQTNVGAHVESLRH